MRVAIAGAGIGGLTTALLLARAGIDVEIFERSAEISEVGAGLQISPNAGKVLARLGLSSGLDRVAVAPTAIEMRSARTGRQIVSLPLADAAARYGAPYRLLHRADLQQLLLEAVESEARIRIELDAALSGPIAMADAVTFDVSGRLQETDLLIGADGVHSPTRIAIGGRAAEPAGRTAWRTVIPSSDAPGAISPTATTVFLGERSHVVVYPIRGGTEINVVAIVEERWDGEGWSEPGDGSRLQEKFAGTADILQSLIAAGQSWTRWCLRGVDPTGPWTASRIALVGDAAHAMLPFLAQGAAMAIEDGAVLAQALSRSALTIDSALAVYVGRRRARVAKVWRAAQQSGEIYHLSGVIGAARDLTMATIGGRRLLARYDWIYGWTPED